MPGKVPVEVFLDTGCSGHLTDHLVAATVAADIRKGLQRGITADDGHRPAAEDVGERDPDDMASLQLIDGQYSVPELVAPERPEVTPSDACIATEEEGVAHMAMPPICDLHPLQSVQF